MCLVIVNHSTVMQPASVNSQKTLFFFSLKEMTECLVTVCGQPDPARRNRFILNGCAHEVDGVFSHSSLPRQVLQILSQTACNSAIVLFLGSSERATTKSMILSFCEDKASLLPETFCRISIVIGDSFGEDAIQYECDRICDVETLLGDNESCRLISLTVVRTRATSDSFEFDSHRLTVLFCPPDNADELPKLVDSVCHQLKLVPNLIVCHLSTPDEKLLMSSLRFRSECPMEVFGISEPSTFSAKLRDIRSWTFKVNEVARFTPTAVACYFLNLHPHLAVGDQVLHQIREGTSFVVSKAADGSAFDFAPSCGALDSLWSPHCRVRSEKLRTFLRPEAGMTFVNGAMIVDEVELHHNDRIILGTEVMLRYITVGKDRSVKSQHIVDWDHGLREFVTRKPEEGKDDEVIRKVEELESLIRMRACGACVVMTNPPESHNDTTVWSLDDFEIGEAIGIGANQSICIPSLKGRATLVKDSDGYTLSSGGSTKRIFHGARFVVGDILFLVNDVHRKRRSDKTGQHLNADVQPLASFTLVPSALIELRNELFDLQWSVSSLFDFAFPAESSTMSDPFAGRRRQLADDGIITSERITASGITANLRLMTESLRMIGSQIANELNSTSSDVNTGLLRLLHDRARTIEQLLLGTDSTAPASWKQLEYLQASLGEKLIRVSRMENDLEGAGRGRDYSSTDQKDVQSSAKSTNPLSASPTAFQLLKSHVIIPTPVVGRRIASTIEALSRSGNVRLLWDRYCRDLDSLLDVSGGVHHILSNKQQAVMLAILDVIVAFETGLRHGWIVQGDKTYVEKRLVSWQVAVDQCYASFARPSETIDVRRLVSPLSKGFVSSTSSSRQPSPTAQSRTSSRDRLPSPLTASRKTPSPVAPRAARTPSPLQRPQLRGNSPATLATSPAAFRGRSNQGSLQAGLSRPVTPRSNTATRLIDVAGRAVQPIPTPVPRALSPVVRIEKKVQSASKSPKTLLTKQLMELELGSFKRRV